MTTARQTVCERISEPGPAVRLHRCVVGPYPRVLNLGAASPPLRDLSGTEITQIRQRLRERRPYPFWICLGFLYGVLTDRLRRRS